MVCKCCEHFFLGTGHGVQVQVSISQFQIFLLNAKVQPLMAIWKGTNLMKESIRVGLIKASDATGLIQTNENFNL